MSIFIDFLHVKKLFSNIPLLILFRLTRLKDVGLIINLRLDLISIAEHAIPFTFPKKKYYFVSIRVKIHQNDVESKFKIMHAIKNNF